MWYSLPIVDVELLVIDHQGDVKVSKVDTKVNPADLFTKPLLRPRMEALFKLLKFEDLNH